MNERTILCGGKVCDGTGAEPAPGEVLIEAGRIAAVGDPGAFSEAAAERIDCSGKVISPGFIDAHSHGEIRKLKYPDNRSKLLQGVTTEVDGNCGESASCVPGKFGELCWRDLAGYAMLLDEHPASTNTVVLCGHNSIRRAVMGDRDDAPDARELAALRKRLEDAFAAGAAGWSTGLTYFPGKFAATEELEALAATTRGSGRVYVTHLRSEGDQLFEAVDEALRIARAGSRRIQISHLKTIFARNFHKIDRLMEMLEAARAKGYFLHADRYPYIYSSTYIRQVLPPPYDREVGLPAKMRASQALREEVAAALRGNPRDLPSAEVARLGDDLSGIAAAAGDTVERVCARLVMENPEEHVAFRCMSPDNLKRILRAPWVCAGSDATSMQLDDPGELGHPRAVGTFPRFFRAVCAGSGVGEAVRRMTSLPARIFGIPDRGTIRRGYVADLVVFDAERFDSAAGFHGEDPLPTGVDRVMVAGKTAWCAAAPERIGRFGRYLPIS